MKRSYIALGVLCLICMLAGCASQPQAAADAPGFWLGLVHGWIAPFALVVHLFNHDVRMYAFPNNGGWYDFGFFLGIGSWGGGAAARSR